MLSISDATRFEKDDPERDRSEHFRTVDVLLSAGYTWVEAEDALAQGQLPPELAAADRDRG